MENEVRDLLLNLADSYKDKPREFIYSLKTHFTFSEDSEAQVFLQFADVLNHHSRFRQSLWCLEHAHYYFTSNADLEGESKGYILQGNAFIGLGEFEKARKCSLKGVEIGKKIGNKEIEYNNKITLGWALNNLGLVTEAITYLEESLSDAKELESISGQWRCYLNLGNSYDGLGKFEKAVEYYEMALETSKVNGNEADVAGIYIAMGDTLTTLGKSVDAQICLEEGLRIAQKFKLRASESKAYTNLGNLFYYSRRYLVAIQNHKKALKINQDIGDILGESMCYLNLASVYDALQESEKVAEYQNKALDIKRSIGDRVGQSICLTNMGFDFQRAGDYQRAIEYYGESLTIAKSIDYLWIIRQALMRRGSTYQLMNNNEKAYDDYEAAIDVIETIGNDISREDYKMGFRGQNMPIFEKMVELCYNMRKNSDMFHYAELSKSRAFLDLMSSTNIIPTAPLNEDFQKLLNEEEKSRSELEVIRLQHLRKGSIIIKPGESERLRRKLEDLYNRIEEYDRPYVSLRKASILSIDALKDILKRKNAAIIQYFVTDNRLFIFFISSTQFEVNEVKVAKCDLDKLVQDYRNEMDRCVKEIKSRKDEFYATGKPVLLDSTRISETIDQLSSLLIEQVSEYLTNLSFNMTLVFVPHDVLHYLPLHSLKIKNNHIVDCFATAYSPSASYLQFLPDSKSVFEGCTSFGVEFNDEASSVAEAFKPNGIVHTNVTKEFVKSELLSMHEGAKKNTDVIHFSCHAYFNNQSPLDSGIILGGTEYETEDGKLISVLTAKDIFSIRIPSRLVTLSACETGVNLPKPGDELIGLTRAFLYAGASSMLVSLWTVSSHATRSLMLDFYGRLRKSNNPVTSLREAQQLLKNDKHTAHPYYWAPFVLVGDWE